MSFTAQTWARKLKVGNGIAKALLRHLADVADGAGYSHYGFDTLCRETEFSAKAIRKAAAYLIEHDFLEKQERKGVNGACLTPCWRVLIPGNPPVNLQEGEGCQSTTLPLSIDLKTPLSIDQGRGVNRQGNPTRISKKETKPSVLYRDNVVAALFPDEAKPKRGPRAKPRAAVPSDWEPDAAGVAYAKKHGIGQSEVENFRDYYAANGRLMADWAAAWRMWCRKAVEFGKVRPPEKVNGYGRVAL